MSPGYRNLTGRSVSVGVHCVPVTRLRCGRRWEVADSADVQVTDLTVNDHACLTFGKAEELLDLTAAFVREGLACG